MKFTRRGGQRGMAGTPPGRLQRSLADGLAVANTAGSAAFNSYFILSFVSAILRASHRKKLE